MKLFGRRERKNEHAYFEERLSAYLDDELSAQERLELKRHLESCRDCRWNLETLRQTVQWTRDLPPVPLPRVFTIPALAQPARARRRTWRLPLLQGATALVALLLVFAMVGDFVLTGSLPALAPEVDVAREQAVEVVVTEAVEETVTLQMEAPAAPEEEAPAEKAVAEPPPEAEATQVPPASPTPEPEMEGMGTNGFDAATEPLLDAGEEASKTAPPPAPEAVEEEATDAMPGEAEPTRTPTRPVATMAPTSPVLTAVAEADEPAPPAAAPRGAAPEGALEQPGIAWLRTAEVTLGVIFILLAATTVAVMVRRRRLR